MKSLKGYSNSNRKQDHFLIKILSTSLNRADLLQRSGKYPPPAGESLIMGLEASGYIVDESGQVKTDQIVACLLSGGGYAQF